MPWNPDIYNQFKNIRYRPFFDLMELISSENLKKAVDVGCGTGEQTHILSEKFTKAEFLGIDSSAEMLAEAVQYQNKKLQYTKMPVEGLIKSDEKYDLIFSNAALQWSDDHQILFPELLSMLSENGQFAVQMPLQSENILNKILFQLASEEPFRTQLNSWNRVSPVLSIDEYAQIMFNASLRDLNISVKVYPIIAEDSEQLYQFISGSALIPYVEKLNEVDRERFVAEYKKRISEQFKNFPAIYSFKRLLLYGKK